MNVLNIWREMVERMKNLGAFCNSFDHGKVDKDPGGEYTEKDWLGGEV